MNDELKQQEFEQLKARADLLGVKYHPSISYEKLLEKVKAHQAAQDQGAGDDVTTNEPAAVAAPVETETQRKRRLRDEASKLVRIRVTCMNPLKKEWDGEIIEAGNSVVGSFKKYVPFNGADEGWHVPNIIYQVMKDRQCQAFTNDRSRHGVTVRKGKMIKEFAIEVLPQLTEGELKELARLQAVAKAGD